MDAAKGYPENKGDNKTNQGCGTKQIVRENGFWYKQNAKSLMVYLSIIE